MFDLIRNAFNKTEVNSEQEKRKIVLNVYDMLQPGFITNFGYFLGIGIYHSGIEIGEHEYCFGGHDYENVTGVFMVKPRIGPQGLLFKQSINMGYTNLSQQQVDKVLQEISKEYVGTSYKLLTRNCNHFSEDLCKRLTGKQAPGWVNRAAKLGTMFPCVIPTEWVEPPDATAIKSETSGSPSSSSCSSNTPLKKPATSPSPTPLPPPVTTVKMKRLSSPPSSRRPSGSDSIRLVRAPVMEDDEIDCSSPVKEPDTYRPEVIRSATQLSITAPVGL
ncbi:hypothetical protein INT46_002226 [Mucor plumbeus]|uniref:PPPDE domain-containing protein n=1 Tax=Mucor plumbeus TaxID=97098 RepID=A0A8H7R922_9FUNG|nr:hypothetical protein INT46_002226 [Mucor plumbeus]